MYTMNTTAFTIYILIFFKKETLDFFHSEGIVSSVESWFPDYGNYLNKFYDVSF